MFQFPGQVARNLKTINLTSLSNTECRNSYAQIVSSNLCTRGDTGKGACQVSIVHDSKKNWEKVLFDFF